MKPTVGMNKTFEEVAIHVSTISILVNVLLSVLKFIAGIIGHSGAMVSDAIHSASDVLSTFIVMIGVHVSNKLADDLHPYGHERLESVAALILAILLALTGLGIGIVGIDKITKGHYEQIIVPELFALIASIISITVKEWMYWYTRKAARMINSDALMADAWHHRSDALSSVGSFFGILCARLGFPVLDPIASVVICLFIEKAALEIFKDAIDKMIDKSCDNKTVCAMKDVILSNQEVIQIDELKTRLFGAKVYVEVEIAVDACKTLIEAHDIAENVHESIEYHFKEVKHCMVHVNPKLS